MDCPAKLRKLSKNISIAFVTIFLFAFSLNYSFAEYTSVSLSPSTGTIFGDSTAISVYVNSGSDEFAGVDINLAFTGSVDYLSSSGASRCTSFNVTEGTGTINIECLSLNHEEGETYSGIVATLYFRSTAEGTSTFTFSSVDPATSSMTGGTYTLLTTNNPDSTGLPDSGLFDDSRNKIIIGFVLLLTGIFFNKIYGIAYNFYGNVKGWSHSVKEKKEKRFKERWENKF